MTGAAYATIGTQGLAMAVGMLTLFGGHFGIHLRRARFAFDWPLMQQIVRLGLPASIEQSTRALGLTVMTFLVATFGTSTIASYGIGTRILSFVIIPAMGLSMATSTLVAQNIGARQRGPRLEDRLAQRGSSGLRSWSSSACSASCSRCRSYAFSCRTRRT